MASAFSPGGRSRAKQVGDDFEARLDWLHQRYQTLGIATIWRFPVGCRMVSAQNWVPQKTRPDYLGNIMPMGRAVCFDAKSSSGAYGWTPSADRDRIWRQASDMMAFAQTGGISFFLVEHRFKETSPEFWLVRPEAVAEAASPVGPSSIRWKSIAECAVRVPTCLWDAVTPNWAAALEEYLGIAIPELATALEGARV